MKFTSYPHEAGPGHDVDRRLAHERDMSTDGLSTLDYMHARYYSAALGRFLSVDPGGFEPRSPQSLNRYAYVSNNPLARIDPDGREEATLAPPSPKTLAKWNGEQGKLIVNRNQVRPTNAQLVKVNGGRAPQTMDIDHVQDIQLDGDPLAKENLQPLDKVCK